MQERIEIRPGRSINITIHKNANSDSVAFLIHGLGGRSAQWREQIDLLKRDHTLIVPDLLGHGSSDKPEPLNSNPYAFAELAQDMHALFNKYAGSKNHVFGHSYGCALSTVLASEYHDRIENMVLIAPMPCAPSFDVPFMYKLPQFIMEIFRPLLERKFVQLAFDPDDSPDFLAEELKSMKQNPMYVIKSMVTGMNTIPLIDVSTLHLPVLVVSGEHDKLILPTIQKQFYQPLPRVEFITISNAAHLPHLEQPQLTNNAISAFTNKV